MKFDFSQLRKFSVRDAILGLTRIPVLPPKGSPQRLVILISFVVFVTVVFPFFFWFLTWHGWALDAAQVERGLASPVHPARASAQLMQIGEKLSRGDRSPRQWYPKILELAKNPDEDLRRNVAWMMGKDPGTEEFRRVLRGLLRDPAPTVRLEAALSLAEFHDDPVRSDLTAWLQPFRVPSNVSGTVQMRIDTNDTARPGTVVARINDVDVEAGITGTVTQLFAKDGDPIQVGQALVAIELPAVQKDEIRRALRLLDAH